MIKLKLSGETVEYLLCFSDLKLSGIGKIDEQVGQDFEKYGELKNYTVILEKSEADEIVEAVKERAKIKMHDLSLCIMEGYTYDIEENYELRIIKDCAKVINQFKKGETIE